MDKSFALFYSPPDYQNEQRSLTDTFLQREDAPAAIIAQEKSLPQRSHDLLGTSSRYNVNTQRGANKIELSFL